MVALPAVAIGTSLPELATTLMAAFQRQSDVALGNVLGSNVFNLLAILGLTLFAAQEPIAVPAEILRFDLPVMLGCALLLSTFTWTGRPLGRRWGAALLLAYLAYVTTLLSQVGQVG